MSLTNSSLKYGFTFVVIFGSTLLSYIFLKLGRGGSFCHSLANTFYPRAGTLIILLDYAPNVSSDVTIISE